MWQSIPGYEGLYEANDSGEVRSLERRDATGHLWPSIVLKQSIRKDGRQVVSLSRDGDRATFKVATLVLITFRGPAAENLVCCHKDDNKANNSLLNLRWDTQSSNILEMWANGKRKRRGE